MSSYAWHTLLHCLRRCWTYLSSLASSHPPGRGTASGGIRLSTFFFGGSSTKTLTFDNGMRVEMGKQIAEGGFSYVFEAVPAADANFNVNGSRRRSSAATETSVDDASSVASATTKYALKRIHCADHELVQSCRHEAGVHRSLPSHHPNLLELLGLKFDNDINDSARSPRGEEHHEYNVCYMLFPQIPKSLRGELSQRNILCDDPRDTRRPFATNEVLHLFGGLLDALTAMHDAHLSHRDVKLENVLLQPTRGYRDNCMTTNKGARSGGTMLAPVLMDFGSAGPLTVPLNARREALTAIETAAQHTTLPYRPPELFEGGLRHGPRELLDYGKVDVWSVGCVLFGIMHGASPFEVEFVRDGGGRQQQQHPSQQRQQYGLVRIVECTHLKILGEAPLPPWMAGGAKGGGGGANNSKQNDGSDGRDGKYPASIYKFVRYMVHHDRATRPTIHDVARRFGELHLELTGERWTSYEEGRRRDGGDVVDGGQEYDDFDSLIASRDFV